MSVWYVLTNGMTCHDRLLILQDKNLVTGPYLSARGDW